MRGAGVILSVACAAFMLPACGSSEDAPESAAKPQPAKAKPQRLTEPEQVLVAFGNKSLAKYCLDKIGYEIGKRSAPPSDKTLLYRDRSLDRLTELMRSKPDARYEATGQPVRDVVIEAISNLERGCDKAAARRLELTVRSSR